MSEKFNITVNNRMKNIDHFSAIKSLQQTEID